MQKLKYTSNIKKVKYTSNIFEKLPWNVLTYELLQYYEFPYDIKDSKQGIQQLFLIRKTRMVKKKVMKDGKEIEIEEEEEYMKVVVFFPTIIIKGEEITSNIFNKLYYRTLRITFMNCNFKYFDSDDLLKMNSLTNLTFYDCSFFTKTYTFKLKFPKKLEVFKMQYTKFYIILEKMCYIIRTPRIIELLGENPNLRILILNNINGIEYVTGFKRNKNLRTLELIGLHNFDFNFLKKMIHLNYLKIKFMGEPPDLTLMNEVDYPKLSELILEYAIYQRIVLPRFGKIPNVKKFKSFASISQNGDLSILNGFTNLEELDIDIFVRLETKIEDGWNLSYPLILKKLKRLKLHISKRTVVIVQFDDITFLRESPNIEYLEINGNLKSLNGLSKFDKLIDVSVTSEFFNTTIPIISEIIKRLSFTTYGSQWKTLKIFAGCKNLKRLSLTTYGTDWRHFKIFAECKNLETLIIKVMDVYSFEGIEKLEKLKNISIWYMGKPSSIKLIPLDITSHSLKIIVLNGFRIRHLYFLVDVPNIETLELRGKYIKIESIEGIENRRNLKTLLIPYDAIITQNMFGVKYLDIPEDIVNLTELTINVLKRSFGRPDIFKSYTSKEFYNAYTGEVLEDSFFTSSWTKKKKKLIFK